MPTEEKRLITVPRAYYFQPIKDMTWGVSPDLIAEVRKHAPTWTDDQKIAAVIADGIGTKVIKEALKKISRSQSTRHPQHEVLVPGKIELTVPGRIFKSVCVTTKVAKGAIEIHPKDIITV